MNWCWQTMAREFWTNNHHKVVLFCGHPQGRSLKESVWSFWGGMTSFDAFQTASRKSRGNPRPIEHKRPLLVTGFQEVPPAKNEERWNNSTFCHATWSARLQTKVCVVTNQTKTCPEERPSNNTRQGSDDLAVQDQETTNLGPFHDDVPDKSLGRP